MKAAQEPQCSTTRLGNGIRTCQYEKASKFMVSAWHLATRRSVAFCHMSLSDKNKACISGSSPPAPGVVLLPQFRQEGAFLVMALLGEYTPYRALGGITMAVVALPNQHCFVGS